ncbi:MAG TPA: fimbria/pilus periplasmic chaperone [Candidatus Deferrimicrobiaceae bacterium]
MCLLSCALLAPRAAPAGEWRVAPIRIDLGRDARSGVVTVYNESDERLHLQMKAFEWSQDGEGKDRYEETADILFFPRIMIFDRKEEKILRAGVKSPPGAREKAYRLFLEEIPEPSRAQGANVAVAIRFGLPVFVKPAKEDLRGEIAALSMTSGAVSARVENRGNVHIAIKTVQFVGKNAGGEVVFTTEAPGWYLLAGASRGYGADVPPERCGQLSRIDVEVKADRLSFRGNLVADPSMCAQR